MDQNVQPEELRNIILSSQEPFVMKNFLKWKLLTWSLKDWQNVLKKEKMNFRCGKKSFTKDPQWERTTSTKILTFEEFLESLNNESQWLYFDYKYLKEWFNNCNEIVETIKWDDFGFPEYNFKDSTIWIGSKGAHTPCHLDTYGCNLVTQIHGRKQWLLFPPCEDLIPTRIPYEESSIYSKLNFYSPTLEDFKNVGNCRRVILEPGDVLFVPKKWWHYVENLETSISINVWIPLASDNDDRLSESLVQFFVSQITRGLPLEIQQTILNPNFDYEMQHLNSETVLRVMEICQKMSVEDCSESNQQGVTISRKSPLLTPISILSNEEFVQFLKSQENQFARKDGEEDVGVELKQLCSVINAYTHPDVIELIKNKLLMTSFWNRINCKQRG